MMTINSLKNIRCTFPAYSALRVYKTINTDNKHENRIQITQQKRLCKIAKMNEAQTKGITKERIYIYIYVCVCGQSHYSSLLLARRLNPRIPVGQGRHTAIDRALPLITGIRVSHAESRGPTRCPVVSAVFIYCAH